MNGLTYAAPTLAASSACVAENTSVTFTRVPSDASMRHAFTPSRVIGTLTTTCGSMLARSRPSRSMPSVSVATTSALTGPWTMRHISLMIWRASPFSFAIRDGLVVTPSRIPRLASDSMSLMLPVSVKIFIGLLLPPSTGPSLAVGASRCGGLREPLHHRVHELAYSRDAHRHDITRDHWPDAGWRTCGNDIPGQQRHHCRNERHELRHGKDQLTGGRPLAKRAVHQAFDVERRRIKPDGDGWADRREGVEPLRSGVLVLTALDVTRRHVVHAGHPEQVFECSDGRHLVRAALDHDAHFRFVVDPAGPRRNSDGVARTDHGRGWLDEDQGLCGKRFALLRRMIAVVEADRDDLGRRDRREHAHRREAARNGRARPVPLEEIAFNLEQVAA